MTDSEILLLLVILGAIIFGPLLAIWCVNTLFLSSIAYSFINWFAMLALLVMFTPRTVRSK